jgi:mannose-6-phosphate isomerase-like protein (cupin superfamily)
VVSGKLLLDVEDATFEILPNQGYTVPRGVTHRTRAKEKTIVLMAEGNTVNPKGDG